MQSLAVNNFYVGSGSDFSGVPTKMLSVNGSLRLSVYNPATIFGIHVTSTPISLIYSEITVATGQVKMPFITIANLLDKIWVVRLIGSAHFFFFL